MEKSPKKDYRQQLKKKKKKKTKKKKKRGAGVKGQQTTKEALL